MIDEKMPTATRKGNELFQYKVKDTINCEQTAFQNREIQQEAWSKGELVRIEFSYYRDTQLYNAS
jgi:hypothetical protein